MLVQNKGLMQKSRLAVASEGDLVVLTLGNVEVKLPYETALLLSQWLRVRAKEAKRRAGDTSRHWSAIGTLTDANVTRG
jgi:hypothetical protein